MSPSAADGPLVMTSMPSRSGSQDRALPWRMALLALVAAFGLYANALPHPFLSDDVTLIASNPTIAQLSSTGLVRLWTTPYLQGIQPDGRVRVIAADPNPYRPVTTASYWLNAWITGLDPLRFRTVNVVLHALAAWLVGLLALRWGGQRAGVLAGTVVLLHPVATDVVNRIVGRENVLVVVGMAGFLAAQRGAQRWSWTWGRSALAALSAAVALGAKESGAALVPLALVQAWLGRERVPTAPALTPDPSRAPASRRGRHVWRGFAALGLPAALYAAGRLTTVGMPAFTRSHYDLLESPLGQRPFLDRLPASLTLVWDYWQRLIVPWPLMAFDYPERFPRWSDWEPWVGLALLVSMTVLGLACLRQRHPLALAIAWWLASYFLVSHLLVPTWTYRELRLAYPLLAGAALAVGVVTGPWLARRPRAASLVAGTLATAAALLVFKRNAECTSDLALAEADTRHRPRAASVQVKLGDMLDLVGRGAEAGRAYERAATLAPWSYQAWYQLAGFYERQGRRDEARRAYEHAAEVDPTFPFAFVGLALLALDDNDLTTAARHLAAAERTDPDDPHVQYNLAVLDERTGNRAAALSRLERLVARRPDFGPAVSGLAALRGR